MNSKRMRTEEFILEMIEKLAPGGANKKIYKDYFDGLSDAEFHQYMLDLESGKKFLTVVAPNLSDVNISTANNLKLAKELGHDFFQRVWIGKRGSIPEHLTPVKHLVVDLPLRRASQMLTKKLKVPENNKVVDALTGQPTGESKGSKISYHELRVLSAMQLDNTTIELMKYRGGDVRGYSAMNGMINRYGKASLKTLANYASGVESTRTLKTLLTSAHIKSTL